MNWRPHDGVLVLCLVLAMLVTVDPVGSQDEISATQHDSENATEESDPPALTTRSAWQFNTRERTAVARKAVADERIEDAVEAAETASALRPSDPLLTFNQGTAHLLAENSNVAIEALEKVAKAGGSTASDAAYNLGNAYMKAQQVDDAIDWYEESLRRDPSRVAAKINLELALQQQQQQQQDQEQQQHGPDEQQQQPQQGNEEQQEPGAEEQQQQSALPRFQPRPDMTAEEAASLLEAVEEMERQARSEQEPDQRRAAPGNRDW